MTKASDPPRSIRIRDVAVLATVVLLGVLSFLYQWVQSLSTEQPDSDSESLAMMREEFRNANQVPPFRSITIPNLSLPVVLFRSGPQDTIRMEVLGQVCSIVKIDTHNGYFVYLPERHALAEYEWTNIRFCNHLTLMGNPNVADIERDLLTLPPFTPLTELAKPLAEPQADGPYSFSDLQLTQTGDTWVLSGNVTSRANSSPKLTVFRYELVDGERLGEGRLSVESLAVGEPRPFTGVLPNFLARQVQEVNGLRIKMVLEIATNREFRY
jgi:hypothetical protein